HRASRYRQPHHPIGTGRSLLHRRRSHPRPHRGGSHRPLRLHPDPGNAGPRRPHRHRCPRETARRPDRFQFRSRSHGPDQAQGPGYRHHLGADPCRRICANRLLPRRGYRFCDPVPAGHPHGGTVPDSRRRPLTGRRVPAIGAIAMPIGTARLSLLPFPQEWDGTSLVLRFLCLPKGDPRAPLMPGLPAFTAANLVFEAHLIGSLARLPLTGDATPSGPLVIGHPPDGKADLFDELTRQFNITAVAARRRSSPGFANPSPTVTAHSSAAVCARHFSPAPQSSIAPSTQAHSIRCPTPSSSPIT